MNLKQTSKSFIFVFLSLVASCTALIALINWLVDPWGLFQSPLVEGFNQVKSEVVTYHRLYKAVQMTRVDAEAVILGSSRTLFGLDPKDVQELSHQKTYNGAFASASFEEIYHYFHHALHTQPHLKTAIIGIDCFAFSKCKKPQADFVPYRLKRSSVCWTDQLQGLFSKAALVSSWNTAKNNLLGSAIQAFDERGHANAALMAIQMGHSTSEEINGLPLLFAKEDLYRNYDVSAEAVVLFKRMVAEAKERGVELKIFFSPVHAVYWEALHLKGQTPRIESLKRALSQVHPIWDFTGYNVITTSNLAKSPFYYEYSHYKPTLGRAVIERLYGQGNGSFGYLLTKETSDDQLAQIEQDRLTWEAHNPELVDRIRRILFKSDE